MGPKLQNTKDYSIFQPHEFNRPLKEKPELLKSMTEHGFMPSSPLQCVHNGNGKLKVVRGHHRLHYAKQLGLPVWYVIDETVTDIFGLEGGTGQTWTPGEFAEARVNAGDKDCTFLMNFRKKHNLTLGAASSLVGGECAGSHNKARAIKDGSFRVGDMTHANQVVDITDHCREKGIAFATSTAFVSAISMVLHVPEFDAQAFKHRVSLYPSRMGKRGTVDEYLAEIEAAYNYAAKKPLPLAFRAREMSKERHDTFGKGK